MKRVIIEIKARCTDQERIRDVLRSCGAEFRGLDRQVDTYFRVAAGRLKLREGNIENHLVFYRRDDQAGPKESRVMLLETDPTSSLKEMLVASLGVLVVVDKRREIWFAANVKFHLDVVEGLGTFAEIEAIDADGSIDRQTLLDQCTGYMTLLGVAERDLVAASYSDLLLTKRHAHADLP